VAWPGDRTENLRMVKVDHLGLEANSAELAILTGDPQRAALIAESFGARMVSDRRGFPCYLAPGWHRRLAIVGTGIGAPATAIVTEELITLGVRAIIRIGTCGGLQAEVKPDHLVVSTGCVRDEGTSRAYIDLAFPAVPDVQIAADLAASARANGAVVHLGVTHSKDAYYSEKLGAQLDPDQAARRWQTWRAAGVLATEMEASALFVIASLRGVAAGAIFVVVGKKPSKGFGHSLQTAIDASKKAFSSLIDTSALDALAPRQVSLDKSFLAPRLSSIDSGDQL
jgi:uridine phosphorylase